MTSVDWMTTMGRANEVRLSNGRYAPMAKSEDAPWSPLPENATWENCATLRDAVLHFDGLAPKGDHRGWTVLHVAIIDRLGTGTIEAIICHNTGLVNVGTETGMTPLMLAAVFGRLDIVVLLLDHGADRGFRCWAWTGGQSWHVAPDETAEDVAIRMGFNTLPDLVSVRFGQPKH